jgi:hypothetical protein
MKRKMKISYFVLTVCALIFTACASTKVTDTWKDKTYKGRAEKIIVIMIARNPSLRSMFEGRFVAELQARGNNARQSNKFITLEELPDKDLVIAKIKSTDADTVLVSRLVDSKRLESYVHGQVHTLPTFYYGWGSYYEVAFIDYGYTGDMEVSYVETNLYDVKSEKLIWSGHSKTERSEGEQQLINTFIKKIVKKLSSDTIIR